MPSEYEIVKYTPEFKRQVVELQIHLWGPDLGVNAAHLEWKYERNPYVASPCIYLALYKGQVVGMRGMYGAQWQGGDPSQTWLGLCAGDLVFAPEHRQRGLFTRIMRAALTDLVALGHPYVFSLSASQITLLSSLAMGWRSLGPMSTMQRKGRLASLGTLFHPLDPERPQRWQRAVPAVSLEHKPRPDTMAELVERIGHDGRIRHIRDAQYFAWRFLNPLSHYRFFFWEGTRVEGYLVLQHRLVYRGRPAVSIVDWEATDTQVRADLLKAAIRWASFHHLLIWSVTVPHEAKSVLQANGFTQVNGAGTIARQLPAVLVRPTHDVMLQRDWVLANRQLLDMDNWDLRMIYSDNY